MGGESFFLAFFLFFSFCNVLGVVVAKNSLHLHFLKTLEFRTDVSVTSMPGVAKDWLVSHAGHGCWVWGTCTVAVHMEP
uniref:Uncharacterized protein n=1 Tax=Catagonus wagneri TaxID=51154 RepID=A0A8C3VL72_9CETA